MVIIAGIVALVAIIIKNWDKIKEVLGKVGSWINEHIIQPVANFFKGLFDGIKNAVKTAVDWIKDRFHSIVDFFKTLISNVINAFKGFGQKAGEVISSAFKTVVNGVLGAIEKILNAPIRAINGLISVINAVPGINLGKLSTFNLPRLKVGGIINQPGRGTFIGGAIGGESGHEGVLPLTDTQAMETLGETIGRYITINATILNKMNGKVLSREVQRIQGEQDFAFNN